jgi:hypothetical protein
MLSGKCSSAFHSAFFSKWIRNRGPLGLFGRRGSVRDQQIECDNGREAEDHRKYANRPKNILNQEALRCFGSFFVVCLSAHGVPLFISAVHLISIDF